jgi:DNA-binding NarL/FixJ family response regulator
MTLRLLLVDDHRLFRTGLRNLLETICAEAEFKEAGSGAEAVAAAQLFKPDLVLLDLHLPDQNGIEVAQEILTAQPETRILIVSAESDLDYVQKAVQLGVVGYLLKTCGPEELSLAVKAVLAGKNYLCAEASTALLENLRTALADRPIGRPLLSQREEEVLALIASGLRVKEIAARLEVGTRTVETFRRRLMKKLGCASTAELIRYAIRQGLIQA